MGQRTIALLAVFVTAVSTAAAVSVLATTTIPTSRGTAVLAVLGLVIGVVVSVVGYSQRSVNASTPYW